MKEFPALELSGEVSSDLLMAQDAVGSPCHGLYSIRTVVRLYNELRAAYLDVEEENRILKAKPGEYVKVRDPSKINVADLVNAASPTIKSPDPRLSRESMKEFPELEYLSRVGEVFRSDGDTPVSQSLLDLYNLYNELRAAHLEIQQKLNALRVKYCIWDTFDPRLPGERQVPTEVGLYLARWSDETQWSFIVDVYGQSPYLQMRLLAGSAPCFDKACFGPRLAGPGWRKIEQEVSP